MKKRPSFDGLFFCVFFSYFSRDGKVCKRSSRHECRPLCPPSNSCGKSKLDADALLHAAIGGRPFTSLPPRHVGIPYTRGNMARYQLLFHVWLSIIHHSRDRLFIPHLHRMLAFPALVATWYGYRAYGVVYIR